MMRDRIKNSKITFYFFYSNFVRYLVAGEDNI